MFRHDCVFDIFAIHKIPESKTSQIVKHYNGNYRDPNTEPAHRSTVIEAKDVSESTIYVLQCVKCGKLENHEVAGLPMMFEEIIDE